jgi:hypothetical protein
VRQAEELCACAGCRATPSLRLAARCPAPSRRLARLGTGCGVRAKLGARKTGDSKPCSMTLGSILLPSIGKSGAILTIYMALHQAVRTTGKSTESRPPYLVRPTIPSNKMSTSPESYFATSSSPVLPIHRRELENTREILTYGWPNGLAQFRGVFLPQSPFSLHTKVTHTALL